MTTDSNTTLASANNIQKLRKPWLERLNLFPYLLLTPYLIFFVLFLGYPIVRGFYMSLFDWGIRGPKEYLGLENYVNLFNDDRFWQVLENSFQFVLMYVPAVVVISVLLAVLLHRPMPGMWFFRTAFFIPIVINVSASAIAIHRVMDPQIGLLNSLLDAIGLPKQAWLTQPDWAMLVVAIVVIWSSTGFNIIILLAGLQNIPDEYYEAAQIDGGNALTNLIYITIPLLRPVILLISVLSMIAALQTFGEIFLLTGGGPFGTTTVLAYYLYEQGFNLFRFGVAASVGVVMTAIIAVLTIIQFRFFRVRN